MRPNLMSPRRPSTSGEDSILAMLEREPARKRGGGATGARLAWYGAGAAVAMALTGSLVWLAANNDGMRREPPDAVLADAGKALSPAPLPLADAASPARPAAAPEVAGAGAALHQVALATPVPEAGRASAAVIVDQPPADAPPPLRLLKPAPAQGSATPAPAATPASVAGPTPAASPVREPVRTAKVPASIAAAVAPRPAAAARSEAKAPARPSATAARPRPVLVAKNAPKPAAQPKGQRSAMPAKTAETGVDADVALISAVIVHANGHAPEGSQMTELLCPNDSCQARPSRQ